MTAVPDENQSNESGGKSRSVSHEVNAHVHGKHRRPMWRPVIIVMPGREDNTTLTAALSALATALPPLLDWLRRRWQ
jgi:hypothetical protein